MSSSVDPLFSTGLASSSVDVVPSSVNAAGAPLAVVAHNLSKTFGTFKAVDNISFEVAQGEIFGFLGANGAGKSTAIRMLTGLLKPSSGEAAVAGYDIQKQAALVRKNIGYMSQRFSLYDYLTVKENIYLYGRIYGMKRQTIRERAREMLQKLDFADMRNLRVGSLPPGWKQKLAFSVAIFHRPSVVFLDEPTGGVDPGARRQFWELIYDAAEQGITVFVTTHYMDEAEYCNRVSIMVDGQIKALDSPPNLKKQFQARSMDEVFYALARKAQRSE